MTIGYWLVKGDKTSCGGVILEGTEKKQFHGNYAAMNGFKVSCGQHPGTYRIAGGHPGDWLSGNCFASTLYSRSTCPCQARLIPSQTWAWHGLYQDESAKSVAAPVTEKTSPARGEDPAQHAQAAKKKSNFADTGKPEDSMLLNGVYLWTETTGAGHAFVSVHENNNIYLYTYGRYGRTGPGSATGDGILNFLIGEDARKYYRSELYRMGARAFRIDDADPELTRKFFEDLWNSSASAIQTTDMPDATRRRGHTIDEYDVTGSNCTTHSVAGIKYSGSKIFENGYTSMTTQLPIEAEEDFTIPISLQRYLAKKGSLVVEMTNTFKEQYPNRDNLQQLHEATSGKIQKIAAESAAAGDSLSPYSGGTVGGVLGGSYDVNE